MDGHAALDTTLPPSIIHIAYVFGPPEIDGHPVIALEPLRDTVASENSVGT
jgi:hypothetical protein